jgi:hypothetical protein
MAKSAKEGKSLAIKTGSTREGLEKLVFLL